MRLTVLAGVLDIDNLLVLAFLVSVFLAYLLNQLLDDVSCVCRDLALVFRQETFIDEISGCSKALESFDFLKLPSKLEQSADHFLEYRTFHSH